MIDHYNCKEPHLDLRTKGAQATQRPLFQINYAMHWWCKCLSLISLKECEYLPSLARPEPGEWTLFQPNPDYKTQLTSKRILREQQAWATINPSYWRHWASWHSIWLRLEMGITLVLWLNCLFQLLHFAIIYLCFEISVYF